MKKIKHFLLLVVCFGLFMQVNSAPVDRAIAKKVAISYCKHKTSFFKQSLNSSSVVDEQTLYFSGKPALFVFNFEEGFVITTTDDRAPAIIAYSPVGSFNIANAPAAAKMWLKPIEEYVANLQIANPKSGKHQQWIELQSNNITNNNVSLAKGVNPLTTSRWDQGVGYNDSCPIISTGPGGRCVTGCVATAMSQIMYYHKYPQFGNGSNSYSHLYYGTISQNFNGVEYLWNTMTDISNNSSRAEISKLIYHAGVSVNMNYGPDASGTQSAYAASALQNNFSYRPDIRQVDRLNYTLLNWQRVIKDNIDAHQPVLYSGTDDSLGVGGHAWVCDGYNDNNYFHMNWGWSGAANAYYFLDTLLAMDGTTAQGRFNASQAAVVNIAPLDHKFCYETRVFHEPNFTVTDGSGLSPYKNNSDCRVIIDLDTMGINLTFTYFNTEADHDFLKIYKGDIVDPANLLASYSGTSTPAPISLPQGQGGKLLLVFTSDDAVQGEGWTATVEGVYQGVTNYTKENNVRLYPNPATDNVLITVPELSNASTTVSYFDLTGRMVYQAPAQFSTGGNVFVNVSALTSGIYIMKIESAKTIFSTKLIKK